MKIFLTVDPEIPVPPTAYGGIERIVDGLAKEYTAAGHKVILIANPQSTCKHANKVIGWHGSNSGNIFHTIKNAIQLLKLVIKEKPQAIHSFSRLLYLYPVFAFTKVSVVQSYQRAISKKSTSLASKIAGKKLQFTACAGHLFNEFIDKSKWTAVYNFTDTKYFTFDNTKVRNHFAFLGRIEPIKGTAEAIEACLLANEKLIIAGNIPNEHKAYFNEKVQPNLKQGSIEYIGPVNDEQKKELLQNAKALLFPIQWEEPFGIVMAESLACGTPVIAFNRGSVPEVIINNENGFIVNTVNEMQEKIKLINTINNYSVSLSAKEKFSDEVIAKKYISIFNKQ